MNEYEQAKRVTLKLKLNRKTTKRLLLVAPPFPAVGDELTIGKWDWIVTKVQDEKIIAAFIPEGKKLRQVFP